MALASAETDGMALRSYAVSVLASLSEQKMREFITLFADENTLARLESDMLAHNPNAKTYRSFGEFMADVEQENAEV